jgi:hypothetical protein
MTLPDQQKPLVAKEPFMNIFRELKDIKAEIRILKDREESIKLSLSEGMGDHQYVCNDEGTIILTYKFYKRNFFDIKQFEQDNEKLYNDYIKTSEVRTLRIR